MTPEYQEFAREFTDGSAALRAWDAVQRDKRKSELQETVRIAVSAWRVSSPPTEEEKQHCRAITNRAIRCGLIDKTPCEVCGCVYAQAHHPDYGDPLRVKWLCSRHHGEAHRKANR